MPLIQAAANPTGVNLTDSDETIKMSDLEKVLKLIGSCLTILFLTISSHAMFVAKISATTPTPTDGLPMKAKQNQRKFW